MTTATSWFLIKLCLKVWHITGLNTFNSGWKSELTFLLLNFGDHWANQTMLINTFIYLWLKVKEQWLNCLAVYIYLYLHKVVSCLLLSCHIISIVNACHYMVKQKEMVYYFKSPCNDLLPGDRRQCCALSMTNIVAYSIFWSFIVASSLFIVVAVTASHYSLQLGKGTRRCPVIHCPNSSFSTLCK